MTRLYVAGPMSNLPDLNFPAFAAETARLRGLGFEVISPAEVNPDTSTPWEDCMLRDLQALSTCDGIVMLPGWRDSPGARIENLWAVRTGKTVHEAGSLEAVA